MGSEGMTTCIEIAKQGFSSPDCCRMNLQQFVLLFTHLWQVAVLNFSHKIVQISNVIARSDDGHIQQRITSSSVHPSDSDRCSPAL